MVTFKEADDALNARLGSPDVAHPRMRHWDGAAGAGLMLRDDPSGVWIGALTQGRLVTAWALSGASPLTPLPVALDEAVAWLAERGVVLPCS